MAALFLFRLPPDVAWNARSDADRLIYDALGRSFRNEYRGVVHVAWRLGSRWWYANTLIALEDSSAWRPARCLVIRAISRPCQSILAEVRNCTRLVARSAPSHAVLLRLIHCAHFTGAHGMYLVGAPTAPGAAQCIESQRMPPFGRAMACLARRRPAAEARCEAGL
jgi:hypothetical protein